MEYEELKEVYWRNQDWFKIGHLLFELQNDDSSGGSIKCKACGSQQPADNAVCTSCGAPLGEQQ